MISINSLLPQDDARLRWACQYSEERRTNRGLGRLPQA